MNNKKRFDLNKYKGNYCMNCLSKYEADIFIRYLYNQGKCWASGDSYINSNGTYNTRWNLYREGTVYYFNEGRGGGVMSALLHGYTILDSRDFIFNKYSKYLE